MKLARVASISAVLLEEGLGFLTHKEPTGEAEAALPLPEAEAAARLRRTLERLGPTFVKFGQMLATRVDLFGEPFVEELGKLHADVKPFDSAEAFRILEGELKRPPHELFEELDPAPVAAASIAQVYRARRKDTGDRVAIKVQRPGLEESLLSDLDALLVLSGFIDRLVPPYRRSLVHRVAEEYASRARAETDFLAEASAIERFGDVLTNLPEFQVPALHRELCTARVLVMEWMEGRKLADLSTPAALAALGFDPESFCRSMLTLQLCMAYEHGFVHGDTHPGNIILLAGGRIALIDFGLNGHVPRALREKMLEMLFAQASGRVDEAVESFAKIFEPEAGMDVEAYKAELKTVLAAGGATGSIAENRVTEQLVRGMRVGARYRAKSNSDLFMVIRNLTIVEGIVLRFCPSMDATAEVKTITADIMRRKLFGPTMREELDQLVPELILTLSQRPRLAQRLLKLERSFNEAPTLGDFLRREDVLREPRSASPAWFVVAGLVGVLVGLLLGRVG